MIPFKVKPTRWRQWLSPSFWRHKGIMEALLEYEWDKGGLKQKCEKVVHDALLYGEGTEKIDWKVDSK